MLGLLAGLGELLGNVLNWIFSFVIETLVVPIVKAAIEVVIVVLQYFTSALFYELSVFLLKLIDFVEVLFRALAGLSSNNGSMGAEFSLNGKSGDLLLQFITHKDVLDVFFACAIVGVFLLMITTIFQIIRVEYTTEGANNSKTTILNKSFKSLVNMLMIPIMVVLGVFIGNQVLELIDTATGGGQNARISGCLWVTSASSAMLKEPGTLVTVFQENGVEVNKLTSAGELIGAGVTLAVSEGFKSALNKIFPKSAKPLLMEKVEIGDPGNRDAIESRFLKGESDYCYSNLQSVVAYYNPFAVNYLVLIFAGCLILKALFNCCFGMIDRLYRCTALFIVMPLAVGMAPVKDNLGSWRSNFMSKALSAYGIVISMNIFFTIVQVMLKIDITFTGDFTALPFPNSFMVGLVKSLMVIVGCQMIAKLAGDMGSYFGGGNAEADGAGLAKEATAGLQKAAVVGGSIAMGAGGLALKAAKGAGGLAGKLGSAIGKSKLGQSVANSGFGKGVAKVGKGVGKGIKSGVNAINPLNWGKNIAKAKSNAANADLDDFMKKGNISDDSLDSYTDAKNKVQRQQEVEKRTREDDDLARKEIAEAKAIVGSRTATRAEKAEAGKRIAAANQRMHDNNNERINAKTESLKAQKTISDEEAKNSNIKEAYDKSQVAVDAQSKLASATAKSDAGKAAIKHGVNYGVYKVHAAGEAVRKMAGDTFNMGAVWQTMAPGALKKVPEQYKKAREDALSVSEEGKQMLANEKKAKADRAEADFNKRNKAWIEPKRQEQSQMISTMMVQKVEIANQDLNSKLDKLAKGYNLAKASNNVDDMNYYLNQMRSLNSSVTRPADKFEINNNATYRVNFDMADFKKNLADAIKKHASAEKLESMLQDQLKKWGQEGNAKLLSELHKALEEIKNTVGK